MNRRVFLGTVAAGVLTAAGIAAAELTSGRIQSPKSPPGQPTFASTPSPSATGYAAPPPVAEPRLFEPPNLVKVRAPNGTIFGLPGHGNLVALTVDDGANTEVVKLYTEFARWSGMRLTFFLNGSRPAWTDNAPALRPLVESGQIQLGNHTWSHPNLQSLSNGEIVGQLSKNHDFITNTYGVDARPFFRPPYGYHDPRVNAAAASIGYSTNVMWYGSLSDSGLITEDQLRGFATKWMLPQHIVIGHANWLPVTNCFDYLTQLIRDRQLQPVTLNDVYSH